MDITSQAFITQSLQPDVNETLNFSNTLKDFSELKGIIRDELRDTIVFINFVILCGTISFFGIIFNIINIIVFIKLGFRESVNISLLFLAISDTGSLVFLVWVSILYNPLFMEEHPDWDINDIMYLTVGWPNVVFSRVGSWITVFVTIERYLCIAMPLRVKIIISPKKTLITNIIIFLSIMGSYLPCFLVLRIAPRFNPERNYTVLGLVHTQNGKTVEGGVTLFSAINQILAFVCVIVLTGGLVHKFTKKTKWRTNSSSYRNNGLMSHRDRKLVKMIIFIASIYLICNTPMVMTQIAISSYKEFSISGRYRDLFLVSAPFSFAFQAVNSTANFFVYTVLSSRFYDVFVTLIGSKRSSRARNRSQETELSD